MIFLTLVIIPQFHSFVILVVTPLSPSQIVILLDSINWVTLLPPNPNDSLIFVLCLWSINLLHVSLMTHMCEIFACIYMTKKKWLSLKLLHYDQSFKSILLYVCNSKNSQEQSKIWIVILAVDKSFLPPTSFLLLKSFDSGEK